MEHRFARLLITLLAAQVGLEVVLSFLDWRSTTYKLLWFLTLAFIFAAGYGADRAKMSLIKATLCAIPFVLIGFAHGLINFALGVGERPDNWSTHEEQLAFHGYLIATALMMIVCGVIAFIGVLTSRVVLRFGPSVAIPSNFSSSRRGSALRASRRGSTRR